MLQITSNPLPNVMLAVLLCRLTSCVRPRVWTTLIVRRPSEYSNYVL